MLIIETGLGLPNATSYASVDYLKAFAKARGATVPSSTGDCEVLLLKGMDAMRAFDYQGTRASKAQALDFPRYGVVIDCYSYASTELPPGLLDAQCALALEAQASDLLPTVSAGATGAVIERTVGPITTRYADGGRVIDKPIVQKAKVLLRKLLRNGGGSIPVVRA